MKIVVIGGGAAGVFGAITAAEEAKQLHETVEVSVMEASSRFLTKVAISGGGRCNVTHHNYDPKIFCKNYPRGSQELISPMHQFQAQDMVTWLENRGVRIKTEEDGRMFPITDQSSTIIECLLDEAQKNKVDLKARHSVTDVDVKNNQYEITINKTTTHIADAILVATGSSPVGYHIAKKLGHQIEELAPSLFSFNVRHPLLQDMAGTSFEKSNVELVFEDGKRFRETAPILVTHWGMSGPGILRLSAWAAREMQKQNYRAKLLVNWMGDMTIEKIKDSLLDLKKQNSTSNIQNIHLEKISNRFWKKILEFSKIPVDMQWAHVTKEMIETLTLSLGCVEMKVDGKSRNKEEFVECGGVNRREINWKTMESKIMKGLFFAGEVIDVDGITGGFNLQHAWTTGYIAGKNLLKRVVS